MIYMYTHVYFSFYKVYKNTHYDCFIRTLFLEVTNPNQTWLGNGRVIGKDSDAGRDWGQEEKGTTEDEMAGWHHWLDGRESEWTPGVGDGQGGLACCDSWGHNESDTTERLNWTELIVLVKNKCQQAALC